MHVKSIEVLFFKRPLKLSLGILILVVVLWIGFYFFRPPFVEFRFRISNSIIIDQQLYERNYFLVQKNETNQFYKRLPNLNTLEWPEFEYAKLPTRRKPLPDVFEPVMSQGQTLLMRKLLDIFVERMMENGMSDKFMIYGATLLGSFRHHDLVPWDDDVDVLVDAEVRPMVRKILEEMAPDYQFVTQVERDKFFTKLYPVLDSEEDVQMSRQTSTRSWGWPFLDISYYKLNGTHVLDQAGAYARYYSWPQSMVFPLSYRPLGPKWYPAPHDPLGFLRASYTPSSQCAMFGYSHALEAKGPSGSIECRELGFRYAFVEHRPCQQQNILPNVLHDDDDDDDEIVWSNESLILRTKTNDRVVIHSICIPVPKHNLRAQTYGIDYR